MFPAGRCHLLLHRHETGGVLPCWSRRVGKLPHAGGSGCVTAVECTPPGVRACGFESSLALFLCL